MFGTTPTVLSHGILLWARGKIAKIRRNKLLPTKLVAIAQHRNIWMSIFIFYLKISLVHWERTWSFFQATAATTKIRYLWYETKITDLEGYFIFLGWDNILSINFHRWFSDESPEIREYVVSWTRADCGDRVSSTITVSPDNKIRIRKYSYCNWRPWNYEEAVGWFTNISY